MATTKTRSRSTRKRKPHSKGPMPAAMAPEQLRRIRETLGLTQDQFADELGVQPLTIGLWEGGKTPISKARALAIVGLAAKLSGKLTMQEAMDGALTGGGSEAPPETEG